MELTKDIENLGQVKYTESFWTGKKTLFINGIEAKKLTSKSFEYIDADKKYYIELKGSFFFGLKMIFNNNTYVLENAFKWYEYLIALISFVFVLIWGNSVALCKIIPIVGGAVGGGVSMLGSILSLLAMKTQKKPILRIVVGLLTCLASIAVCALIGFIIVSAIS